MNKRLFPVLLLILALLLPPGASAAGLSESCSRTEAFYHIPSLPDCWNPIEAATPEAELILQLTADRLYTLSSDGSSLTPSMASALPTDVTAAYAGTFGIPESSTRGYAFSVTISENARWENGHKVTSGDFLQAVKAHMDNRSLCVELANLESWYSDREISIGPVVSLREAGFSSRKEAEEQGHSAFYVDTSLFWGLDSGWVSISDRTRLKDTAIPSGVTEMYVSGAYLYNRYLADGASMSRSQSRYLGVSMESAGIRQEDIGILTPDAQTLVLILAQPTTAQTLALRLMDLIPVPENQYAGNYATSPATYTSCGPWRIASVSGGIMELHPNPHYGGSITAADADLIRLIPIGT